MDSEEIEELIIALEDNYSDEDIPEEDFQLLKEMLVSLDDFHKDIDDLSDDYLKEIIEAWIEHRASL